MATTRAKLLATVDALRATPTSELAPEARDAVEMLQIMQGFGFDPLANIVPDTDAEADLLVDQLIALLIHVRGDDLPPFDLNRYGESEPAPA